MNIKNFLIGSVAGVIMFGATIAPAFAANTTVYPGNQQGWAFFDDNGNGGSGSFVNGPATPPLGLGSAQLSITASNQGYALGKSDYAGVKLSDITSLSYSTYVQTGNNTVAPALQLNIDPDLTVANTNWYGRLVYEPYYTHSVVDGTWQTWNTQDNATSGTVGNWWFSNGTLATNTGCLQATPCTWNQVLSKLSNAGINVTYPGIAFKAGSNWAVPFVGNVDAFTIGINGTDTTYDFEASVDLTVPSITTPVNGATVTSAALTDVAWTASTGTFSPFTYQYEAFSDAAYTSPIYTSGWLTTTQIPTPGTPDGIYYVRVRAQDAEGNLSAWSNDSSNPYEIIVSEVTPTPTPIGPPTNMDQCKNDSWKTFNNPTFKNQGDCVSYVQSNSHAIGNKNK